MAQVATAYSFSQKQGVIKIVGLAGANVTIGVKDTFGNATMTAVSNGVFKYADLPPAYDIGPRVEILAATGQGNNDPYFVTWTGSRWVETRAYGGAAGLAYWTLPHQLQRRPDGVWECFPSAWAEKLVGDENTNPTPSFVGKTVRDIFFYRNRLGMLAGDSCVMSRSGDYFNFWSATATEVLDTDPIDIGGASESVDYLDWAVPFDEGLLIWATRKQQFILEGGEVLSPLTAKLSPVSGFDNINTARPKQLGGRIVYPSSAGGYTQLGVYKAGRANAANSVDPITDHVPEYLPENPRDIEVAENAGIISVTPQGLSNDMFVFKYEESDGQFTQKAWQKFTFSGALVKAHWVGRICYMVTYRISPYDNSGYFSVEKMDFSDTVVDPDASFNLKLDRRCFVAGAASTDPRYVNLTVPDAYSGVPLVFRAAGGAATPCRVIGMTQSNLLNQTKVTYLLVEAPASTGTFIVGEPFTMKYTFSEVFMRDRENAPVMAARIKLLKVLVRFVNTGYFRATVSPKAGGTYSYPYNGELVGMAGQLLGGATALSTGEFSIPVQAQAEGTVISLESDSHLPCRFPYAEWQANVVMKAQR